MKVYERLSQAFKAEGTTNVFGMMGDGNMYWVHELHKLGVKVHEVRHEGAGLGMADGYAMASGKLGVVNLLGGNLEPPPYGRQGGQLFIGTGVGLYFTPAVLTALVAQSWVIVLGGVLGPIVGLAVPEPDAAR